MSSNKRLRRQPTTPALSLYRAPAPSKRSRPVAPRRRRLTALINIHHQTPIAAIPAKGWSIKFADEKKAAEPLIGFLLLLSAVNQNEAELQVLPMLHDHVVETGLGVDYYRIIPPGET